MTDSGQNVSEARIPPLHLNGVHLETFGDLLKLGAVALWFDSRRLWWGLETEKNGDFKGRSGQ